MSVRERYANNASTSLNGSINNSVTSITVASSSGFPSYGTFRILVESEIMIVTNVSGTTWTVVRGAEGTTAASHADSTPVVQVVTAGSLTSIIEDNWLQAAHAPVRGQIRDASGNLMTVSSFSWVNQGSSTATDVAGGIWLVKPSHSGESVSALAMTAPSTPYTVTFGIRPATTNLESNQGTSGEPHCLVGFRDSSSGRIHTIERVFRQNQQRIRISRMASATSRSTDDLYINAGVSPQDHWVRITDDGTDFTFELSPDGVNWWEVFSIARTTYTASPNQIVFGANGDSQNAFHYGTYLFHMSFSAPKREVFGNNSESTLNGSINNSTTSVTVTSASSFPSTGNFRVRVEDEIMLVTGVSGNTFTVQRGIESTSAASHADGLPIYHILTAGALDQLIKDNVVGGLSVPLYGKITDKDGNAQTASSFTWLNQGSATVSDVEDLILLSTPAEGSINVRGLRQTIPSASTWVWTVGVNTQFHTGFQTTQYDDGQPMFLIGTRQSADSKMETVEFRYRYSNPHARVTRWTNNTTVSSTVRVATCFDGFGDVLWLRIEKTSTNYIYSFSNDGVNFLELANGSYNTFLSGTIDECIIAASANNRDQTSLPLQALIVHSSFS